MAKRARRGMGPRPRTTRSNRKINAAFATVRRTAPQLTERATVARSLRKARAKGAVITPRRRRRRS